MVVLPGIVGFPNVFATYCLRGEFRLRRRRLYLFFDNRGRRRPVVSNRLNIKNNKTEMKLGELFRNVRNENTIIY